MLEGVVILVSGILLLTPWLFDRRSWTSWTDAMEQAATLSITSSKRMQRESLGQEIQYLFIAQIQTETKNKKDETIEGEFWEDK